MILHCCKTGREWPITDAPAGDRMSRRMGLKDYVVFAQEGSA